MTKAEWLNRIVDEFDSIIVGHYKVPNRSSDSDRDSHIKRFKSAIESMGLSFGENYHACGIGNNNEMKIYLKEIDSEGFVIEKNIAKFHYVYGIYGGMNIWIEDYNTNAELRGVHHAK